MKNLFPILLLLLAVTGPVTAQVRISTETTTNNVNTGDLLLISRPDGHGGYVSRAITLQNLINGANSNNAATAFFNNVANSANFDGPVFFAVSNYGVNINGNSNICANFAGIAFFNNVNESADFEGGTYFENLTNSIFANGPIILASANTNIAAGGTNVVMFKFGDIIPIVTGNPVPLGQFGWNAAAKALEWNDGTYAAATDTSHLLQLRGNLTGANLTNYGNVTVISNAPGNPNSIFQMPIGGAFQLGAYGQLWDNFTHGGGAHGDELQWSFDLMSFNPQDTVGHVQMTLLASQGPQSWYLGSYGAGTRSQQPSSMFGYRYGWSNSISGAGSAVLMTQVNPFDTNGTSQYLVYDPVLNVADPNTQPTTPRISAISGFGTQLYGNQINDRQVGVCASNGTFNLNLGQRNVDLLVNGAGTIAITNTAFLTTTNALVSDMMINGGLASANLTWSPAASINLIWENEAGNATAPSSVALGKMLHVTFSTEIRDNKTNVFAHALLSSYTTSIDTTASSFFSSSGTLLAAESNMVNFTLTQSKAHGYFANLIDFHPFVGATSNSCSWNAINTAKYRIAWHSTTSTNFTVNGVYGDGTAMWADMSGLVPSTEITSLNSSMFGVWVRGPAQPSGAATANFYGVLGNNANVGWGAQVNGTSDLGGTVMQTFTPWPFDSIGNTFIGFLGANRTSGAFEQHYMNSTIGSGANTAASALATGQDVGVWCRQQSGADHFCNANLTAIVCGQNMTPQNMTDMIADLGLFNQGLGR